MAKRRADDGDDDRPARRQRGEQGAGGDAAGEEATIGQRTSHIRNKQRRSEVYHQLKHKQAVRPTLRGRERGRKRRQRTACLMKPRDTRSWVLLCLCLTPLLAVGVAALLPATQVAKRKARVKRQAEVANAYEAGVLPPPRAVPKVRQLASACAGACRSCDCVVRNQHTHTLCRR